MVREQKKLITMNTVRDYPLLESKQQIQIDHARTGQTKSEQVRQLRPCQHSSESEHTRTGQTSSDQDRTAQTKSEQVRPPQPCHVRTEHKMTMLFQGHHHYHPCL